LNTTALKNSSLHLVVIIPAFNEAATIASVINAIPHEITGIRKTDVVVIDDGSTDNTREIAEDTGALVVSHKGNMGVGRAYVTGIHEALQMGSDIIVNIDADGQFDPKDIPVLIQPILSGDVEFVTASRFKDPSKTPAMPISRLIGNKAISLIISLIIGKRFYDVSCGFRACTRETALRLNLSGSFTYTQETFLELAFKDINVYEVPVVVQGTRAHGQSKVASNLLSYGHRALRIILRAYRDYWPWQFFSRIALVCFSMALVLFGWLFYWRISRGLFSPHVWAGFIGGFFFIQGMMCLLMGMVADMLRMIRLNAEHSLYFDKKRHYDQSDQVKPEVNS